MSTNSLESTPAQGSLSYRVLTTRVFDLVRGEVTGPFRRTTRRTAYVRLIAASGLREETNSLVRIVAKRTRLWPSERVEVAKELIAHFREGLETGASAEKLVQDFGEVRTAAKLIRRAKRRARPAAWQAWHRSQQAAAAALVIVGFAYGTLAVRYFGGSPAITRNCIAELNAGLADVPEDERAWPIYIAALDIIRENPEAIKSMAWPVIKPGDERWDAAIARNAQLQPAIVRAIEAGKLAHLGLVVSNQVDPLLVASHQRRTEREIQTIPFEANPPILSVNLAYLGELSRVSRHLRFDARRAAHEGDAVRVIADIEAIIGAARHARSFPLSICRIVGDAIHGTAASATQDTIARHPALLTNDQLVSLAHLFASSPIEPISSAEIDAERAWFDDFLQRAYTDDGKGNGRLTPEGVRAMQSTNPPPANTKASTASVPALAPLRALDAPHRNEATREYDRLMRASLAELAVPIWDRGQSAVQTDLHSTRVRDRSIHAPRPGRMFFPNFQSTAVMIEIVTQRVEVTTIAIALELYRRQYDHYPDSLDELVPVYLPAAPLDRFDGQPMRYALAEGRPVVYSIGADLDDDGGRKATANLPVGRVETWPAAITSRWPAEYLAFPIPDGDWVLYAAGAAADK